MVGNLLAGLLDHNTIDQANVEIAVRFWFCFCKKPAIILF